MMEKKRYRTDDSVELSFRRFATVVNGIGVVLIICALSIGLIAGVAITMETEELKPMFMGLLWSGTASILLWLIMKLITLVLTYITDIHYYSRTQMEVALETAGIEIAEPESESWTCENCGKTHGNDVSFCTNCGTKKPEKN